MSIETLRQNLWQEAGAGGQITIHAATFTAALLTPPPQLDAALSKAFVEINPAVGLVIATSQEQVGPVTGGTYFDVTGSVDLQIAAQKPVQIRFAAAGQQGQLVLGINLGDAWLFGESFPSLTGKQFALLGARVPWFFFAGQPEAAWPWNGTSVALAPGLNFAGSLALTGYLEAVVDILSGLVPQAAYSLVGPVDPSQEVQTGEGGAKLYSYPGLDLTTPNLSAGAFTLGYLTVEAPYLRITLVDYGEPVGKQPAVMLASALTIPGSEAEKPEIRAALPVNPRTQMVGFSLVNPSGRPVFTADQLFALMAGQTWFGLVPPALSTFLQGFGFVAFGVMVSYRDTLRLSSVQAVIASSAPWVVIEEPRLALAFDFDWTIMSPLQEGQSQYAQLTASASFMPDLFPAPFFFTIDTDMVVSGGYAAADESEYVSFGTLVEAMTGGAIKIPAQYVTIDFQEFFLTVNQPARSFALSATTSIKLPVLGEQTFELNDVAFRLRVQRPQDSAPGGGTEYSGSITGNLLVGPLYLLAEGSYGAGIWNFGLSMQPGTAVGLQDLLDAIFEAISLPQDLFAADLSISGVWLRAVVPAAAGQACEYSGGGAVNWSLTLFGLHFETAATVALHYKSTDQPNPFTGSVTADLTFDLFGIGTTFTVGYAIANDPDTHSASEVLFISWQGLTARYVQGSGQTVLEFTADDTWNLGRLIKELVRLIYPGSNVELPTPWNLLNNISLAGLKVTFNTTTREVRVSWPLVVDLFFAQIESLDIVKTPDGKVEVTLTGTFVFGDGPVSWDAASENPPEVPGGGDSAFDLRLLALGQHVSVPDLKAVQSIGDAVDQLAGFTAPPPETRVVPIGPGIPVAADEPKPPLFAADSNWLVGAHFLALSGTLELKAIFNDPVLYGLRVNLAGEKAGIFDKLAFEILYKRVTETIGMYKVMLQLPDAMRYLQFGQVTVILPLVGVEIYTNGNFKVDFGFPYNLDFSRSFTVQVFPFTGSGGFYFGVLNGATSSQVPQNVTCGTFSPVIEFGLGLQVGLGKAFSAGILRAEVAVTVFGILEGALALWQPYNTALLTAGSAGSADVAKAYYYKVSGTLGIIGKVVGVVDFAVVKAAVNLTVYAYIQGVFEAYRVTVITMEAGVIVALTVRINCGLFKISLKLSFSTRIRESFSLGRDRLSDAPWSCGGNLADAPTPAQRLLDAARLYALAPDFSPLQTPTYGVLPLNVYFMPHLSVAAKDPADKQSQSGVYAINLFIANESQSANGQTYAAFERLARETFLWVLSSFSGRAAKGTPDEELQQATSAPILAAAKAYLAVNADGRSLQYPAIAANLAALFTLEIQLPPAVDPKAEGADATALPMPPELTMQATYKGQTLADVDFLDWVMATDTYISAVQEQINQLIPQLQGDLGRSQDPMAPVRQLLRQGEPIKQSIAQFVFGDYFALLAQSLVQSALDGLNPYAYPLAEGDSIASIRERFNQLQVDDAQNRLTDEQIAWENRSAPLTVGLGLRVSGVPYRIESGDTWAAIAAVQRLNPGQMAVDNAAEPMVLIPGTAITIGSVTQPVTNDGTLGATAKSFGMSVYDFAFVIGKTAGLLSPLTVITLNNIAVTTAAGESIETLATALGIDLPTLTPSIAATANLFDRVAQPRIFLPDLQVLPVADLWADITAHDGIAQLSGMAARYLLAGLRLPVAGLSFASKLAPCVVQTTCGLQSLTGQQFTLPYLEGYDAKSNPLTITLTNGRNLAWIAPAQFAFSVPQEAALQELRLVKAAQTAGLQAPIQEPQPLRLLDEKNRRYTLQNNIVLQTAAPLPLPIDQLPAETTRRPRIWPFPPALSAELARPTALAPAFAVAIGAAAATGSQLSSHGARAYGYGSLIHVAVKRVVAAAGGRPVSPTTYELAGADEVGIALLERLLGAITPQQTAVINGIYILYAPNPTSDRAEGLQYDGQEQYATFLVQSNLSTETNPPESRLMLDASEPAARLSGLLNPPYTFLNRLWAGSIVRSGGYYFTYELPDGSGLPESLFNEDDIAQIAVLILYNNTAPDYTGEGGVLRDYMNVAVVDDPVDPAAELLFVESLPRRAKVGLGDTTTLQQVADDYHLGVTAIARANASHLLASWVTLRVTDIVHQVGRGESLEAIATHFGTTALAIMKANPNIDWAHLTAGIGLHIPDVTTRPAEGSPGLTLATIAAYYDTTVEALAWANRDVKGLFAPSTPLLFDDRLVDKQSVLPPGNVGLVVQRANPGPDSSQAAVYLEQQYNMLGYDLITSNDFTALANALPLPATPTTELSPAEAVAPRLRAPQAELADEDWLYTFVVPVARAAHNNPIPSGTNPAPAANPYAGVGGFAQLSLDWRDMLGNRTWSPFADQTPTNSYPLNFPPVRVGFADDVIGLSGWPSTRFQHYFTAGQTAPQLVIEWCFDNSRYDRALLPPDAPGALPAWQENALADRQVFANLYYQLNQTGQDKQAATVMSTLTSLDGDTPTAVTPTEAAAIRQYVLSAWQYLEALLGGDGALPPATDLPAAVELRHDIVHFPSGPITAVTAAFRLERCDAPILAEFRDEDSIRAATTAIGPRMEAATEGDPGLSLAWYTQQFQTAFDSPTAFLRLAVGVPRSQSAAEAQAENLWLVRFGKVETEPYYYRLNPQAITYAPAPLSTVLINRSDVTLYTYTPDGGLLPSATTQSFTGVDLDVWARLALSGIDQLLSPQFAVPAFLVDKKGGTDYLQQVLDAKFRLADSIALGVTNILTQPAISPDTHPQYFAAAREKLRQQLLDQLANTYAIDAIVQHEVTLTGPALDPEMAPRLYGGAAEVDTPGATEVDAPSAMKDYTTGAFKIPLTGGTSLLTYPFRTRDAARQSHVPLQMAYLPTHIEHQIGAVPGVEGYRASSWLTFIDSLPPIATGSGSSPDDVRVQVDVPIPLRAYPTPPSLENQAFLQENSGDDPTITLEEAKRWSYRYLFARASAVQDRIDSVIRFNVPAAEGMRSAGAAQLPDLFVLLARINHVAGALEAAFGTDLIQVTTETDPASPSFQRAQSALAAFATLVAGEPQPDGQLYGLPEAWQRWVESGPGAGAGGDRGGAAESVELPLSVLEDVIEREVTPGHTERLLRVKIALPAVLPDGMQQRPMVTFDGYVPEAVDPNSPAAPAADHRSGVDLWLKQRLASVGGTGSADVSVTAWVYKAVQPADGQAAYLTWDQAQAMPDRRIDLAQLDAIRFQNGWANLRIIRNLDLVGGQNLTREPFVYRTPAVQFRNKLTPLLDTDTLIDVAAVGQATPAPRTLTDHLTALFTAFFSGSPSQEQLVSLEVQYGYDLSKAALPVELPVLLIPPTAFAIPDDWAPRPEPGADPVPAAIFIDALSQKLTQWYQAAQPSSQHGRFRFDLSAFSSLSNNTQPLVRVRNLVLKVADICG